MNIDLNIELWCYDHFIKQNDIIYDIGAHIGEMSNLFINKGAKTVYAFEPSKYNFSELELNTKNKNIICYNIGFHEKQYSCITNFKHCRNDIERNIEQEIYYEKFDEFIQASKIKLPDFIKIDIEGMESIIFKTFNFLFEEKRPIIFVELYVPEANSTHEDYKDNPLWKSPEEGGYDFNNLKKYNYCYIDKTLNIFNDGEFNPPRNSHLGRIFIPKEKLNLYI